MVKEVRLFIGRDQRSLELFRMINEVLGEFPPGERPKLKVKTFKLKDPSQFKAFVKQLEDLFGGMYTVEIRKYGINAIPAIVVDGEKVLEGEYPTLEKLREILLGAPVVVAAAPEPQEQPAPLPPLEPSSIEPPSLLEEKEAKPQKPAPPPQPAQPVQPSTFTPALPVEEPEEFKLEDEEPTPPPQPPQPQPRPPHVIPPTPKTQPTPQPGPPRPPAAPALPPSPPPVEKPLLKPKAEPFQPAPPPTTRPPPPAPPQRIGQPKPAAPRSILPQPGVEQPSTPVQPPKPEEPLKPVERREEIDLSKTCLTCIFYSKERKRCTLYHIPIEDPYHPPPICERVKR